MFKIFVQQIHYYFEFDVESHFIIIYNLLFRNKIINKTIFKMYLINFEFWRVTNVI